MMENDFTVYILYSERYDKIYVGYTSDLEARILSHNELSNKGWTKKFRPWKLIHTEKFDSVSEALKREKQLKSANGRKFARSLLHPSLFSNGLISAS